MLFVLNVVNTNDAPTPEGSIADQTVTEGEAFTLVTSTAFVEVDSEDVLTYSVNICLVN